jgi:multidrug efflux pump subunit AcrA (membrane-fusion protein)
MKTGFAVFGLASAWVLLGCGTVRENGAPVPVQVLTVSYAPPVTASGQLSLANVVNVQFQGPGIGVVQKIAVKVGDRVNAGQVLAIIQCNQVTGPLPAAVPIPRLPAVVGGPPLVQSGGSDIRALQAKIASDQSAEDSAKARLDAVTAQYQPDALKAAQADQDAAQTAVTAAAAESAKKRSFYEQGLIARRDAERAEAALVDAQVALDAVKERVLNLSKGPRAEDVAAAKEAYSACSEALSKDQELLRASEQTSLRHAESSPPAIVGATLPRQRLETSQVLLRAPIAGVVVACNAASGAINAPVGGLLPPSAPNANTFAPTPALFQISPDARLTFGCIAPQALFQAVQVGQEVTLKIPRLGDRRVAAKIVGIAPVVTPPSPNGTDRGPVAGVSFSVQAILTVPDKFVQPGDAAELVVGEDAQQILIPLSAIRQTGLGEGEVFVEEEGFARVRTVHFDLAPNGQAKVTAGLKLGDHLVVLATAPLVDGRPTEDEAPSATP